MHDYSFTQTVVACCSRPPGWCPRQYFNNGILMCDGKPGECSQQEAPHINKK